MPLKPLPTPHDAVAAELHDAYYARWKSPPPPPDPFGIGETADAYRTRIVESLAGAAGMPQSMAKTGPGVIIARANKAAQTGPLTEIKERDRTGRECSRFIGRKSDWMGAFQRPAMESPIYIGGVPQRLKTIVS